MSTEKDLAQQVADLGKYEAGFVTDIESDKAPKGLNEDIIRFISRKKQEPDWLLQSRLKAFAHWQTMPEPHWAKIHHPPIDYQDTYYYAAPKPKLNSMDEVDPALLETFEKLGVPMRERAALAHLLTGSLARVPFCCRKISTWRRMTETAEIRQKFLNGHLVPCVCPWF